MTVEEFRRQREERLRGGQRRTPEAAPRPEPVEDDYDLDTFDPTSLRSDR